MKHILITSKHSYIGCQLKERIAESKNNWDVDLISIRTCNIQEMNLSKYDTIVHVAGLVHKHEKVSTWESYYKSNVKLTIDLAQKAKQDGVSCFLFMSSMSVYGMTEGYITKDTKPAPNTFYGKTKWIAEQELMNLITDSFKVIVVRPPMVYGKGCPGNYQSLSKIARISFFFPKIENRRSMIYIEDLCEFLYQILLQERQGIYFPQNAEYVATSELVKEIARVRGHFLCEIEIASKMIIRMKKKIPILKKVFGSLVYEEELSIYKGIDYQKTAFRNSVELTEMKSGNEQ